MAKRVEEVAALFGANPLPLMAVILIEPGDETGGDVEAAKARTLAAHLAAYPQDAGRPIEWSTIHINLVSPAIEIEAPRDREVHYTTVDGRLTLTNAEGEPIEIDGRRFSRLLGPDDDEVAVAEHLARGAHLGAASS